MPIVAIILLVVGVAIFRANIDTRSTKITIVGAENMYANIASQIGGTYVSTTGIITNPNADPHEYESSAVDATNIANAHIVIENGAGYDSFIDHLLAASPNKNRVVINVQQLLKLPDDTNPHLWYSLAYMETVAKTIETDLAKQDPPHSTYYEKNYHTFVNSLQSIETVCATINSTYHGVSVIATERVFDYMLATCGLSIIPNDFQKAVEEGNDPSVASILFFQNQLQTKQARVLLYNTQTISQITQNMKTLANQQMIPVVGVSETMPMGGSYQSWMLSETKNLLSALEKNA